MTDQNIHWKVCQYCKASYHKNWYEHKPEPVFETESARILWDFAIHTNRKICANRPDITIKDHENNPCLLFELIFPVDKNFIWRIWKNIKIPGPGN